MSEWYEELRIENKVVKFQLVTGANCNILSYQVIQDLGIQCHYEKTQVKLKSYSGHQIPAKGVVTLPCEHKGKAYCVKFHVVEIEAPALLSAQTRKEMGLLARIQRKVIIVNKNRGFQSVSQLRVKPSSMSTQI